MLAHALECSPAQGFGCRPVAPQCMQPVRKAVRIVRFDQKSTAGLLDDFDKGSTPRLHDRHTARHRFNQKQSFRLIVCRRHRQHIDALQKRQLPFAVNLNLQGDELHLSAGFCWLSWSPTRDPEVVAEYREAVRSILAGRHRVVEHWAGGKAVRGEIQALVDGEWRTLGARRSIRDLLPGKRERRVLQSEAGSPTTR